MSVRDNLREGKYENKVLYSIPPMEPIDETTTTIAQAKVLKEQHAERKRQQRRLHNEEDGRLTDLLKSDLESENGLVGHPKADVLWRIAWEHGHSSGYSDVINWYEDLVELVK